MFGKKKQPPIRTLIGEGSVIRGELRFEDGLRIDGEVIGDVVAAGDRPSILVISEKARVTGKVKAGHVIINGSVQGPVVSDELLGRPRARLPFSFRYFQTVEQAVTLPAGFEPFEAEIVVRSAKLRTPIQQNFPWKTGVQVTL